MKHTSERRGRKMSTEHAVLGINWVSVYLYRDSESILIEYSIISKEVGEKSGHNPVLIVWSFKKRSLKKKRPCINVGMYMPRKIIEICAKTYFKYILQIHSNYL